MSLAAPDASDHTRTRSEFGTPPTARSCAERASDRQSDAASEGDGGSLPVEDDRSKDGAASVEACRLKRAEADGAAAAAAEKARGV